MDALWVLVSLAGIIVAGPSSFWTESLAWALLSTILYGPLQLFMSTSVERNVTDELRTVPPTRQARRTASD
jgi:hypothetical protein